jgi:hypothetical protein
VMLGLVEMPGVEQLLKARRQGYPHCRRVLHWQCGKQILERGAKLAVRGFVIDVTELDDWNVAYRQRRAWWVRVTRSTSRRA